MLRILAALALLLELSWLSVSPKQSGQSWRMRGHRGQGDNKWLD